MTAKQIFGTVVAVIAGIIILFATLGSFETIDQGERGVKLRYGQIVGTVDPGLTWKVPFTDTIKTVSVQNKTYRLDSVSGYSADQQPAKMVVSITFKIPESDVEKLYSEYGTINSLVDRTLTPRALDIIKGVFGTYTAQSAINNRQEFVMKTTEQLKKSLVGEPVELLSVQVEGLSFTDSYERTIEDKQKAEVMVQTNTQTARALVAKAEGEKQAAIKKAEGEAQAVILAGEAEAQAIRAKSKALQENPNLVNLVIAEKWSGVLPTTMIPNAGVPLLNLK